MIVTHKIKMDLSRNRTLRPALNMVQGDSNTRALEISLYDNGQPWGIPAGASAVANYKKEGGASGLYDLMPDGSTAWSIAAPNTLTVYVAPQVLTVKGRVEFTASLVLGDDVISTFRICIVVEPRAGYEGGIEEPEPDVYQQIVQNYVNLSARVTKLAESIASGSVTPEAYGAVGDGIADDTAAIQAALNAGGTVYFPPGRYKVTAPLVAIVPCVIKMAGAYPSVYNESVYEGYDYPMADYPTGRAYNHFGARIETYATGSGLLIGESVVVDGLNIRAMEGFSGTVLKYDGSRGVRSYPSNTRLEHIKISNDNANVRPDIMFDFFPYGNYGVIVNDVIIGSNHARQYASYGFKCILNKWVNSLRISNVNVEMFAKYPFYINGATPHEGQILYAANWVLKNICLQAYPKKSYDPDDFVHQNMLYLDGMTGTYITGCKIWDVEAATVKGDVVKTADLRNTTAIGNDNFVDAIDKLLTAKIVEAGELNLSGLEVSVNTSADGTGNTVTMRDGRGNVKPFTVPAATLTDEQVGTAVGNWMVENGEPVEQVGRNKLNPDECWDGDINQNWGHEQESKYAWVTGFIPCAFKDEVRAFETVTNIPGGGTKVYRQRSLTNVYEFDSNRGYIGYVSTFTDNIYTPSSENVAYCRIHFDGKNGNYPTMYEDRDKCMVTINTSNSELEPYKIELVGGIGQYLKLKSPNGTNFTLSVNDDGTVVGIPVS